MTRSEVRAQWVQRRRVLEEIGDLKAVKMIDRFLTDLDGLDDDGSYLTLTAAAALCGFSQRQLSRGVKSGAIPNYGRPKAPKVRLQDLPMKPSALRPAIDNDNFETARGRIAKSVINQNPEG